MRIGPFFSFFFLFPLFYLSCHYVSSAVFNDGSSLQAVSGCTAGGGEGAVEAGEQFSFFFFFDVIVFKRRVWQMPRIPTTFNNAGSSSFIIF